ncbi:MAG: lytic murein transglycosylase B [Gammaproteobacteria bacterium]|nr:lytic murein transglycosylase B [Gammaproteobacteria bacterium]
MQRLVVLFLLLCSAWGAFATSPEAPFIERNEVKNFINTMVEKHQFKKAELTNLFKTVQIRPQVIANIKKPLEKHPWYFYQMLFVSDWRIQHGVEFWNKHAAALRRAEDLFGVPAGIIVATIGVETRYGQRNGDFRVIDSLSNIAFSQSPRAGYFRKELEEFLLLSREQHLNPAKVMGSYAGAIGQPQFMPSSYRYYAINFSKSGKTDLINDEVDIIGSVANYYKKHGWQNNKPVASQATVIGDRYRYLKRNNQLDQTMTVKQWVRYGILSKSKPNEDQLLAKVIELETKRKKEFWLGYTNFDVIKRYNSSDLYAMAVHQLSQHITELHNRVNKK